MWRPAAMKGVMGVDGWEGMLFITDVSWDVEGNVVFVWVRSSARLKSRSSISKSFRPGRNAEGLFGFHKSSCVNSSDSELIATSNSIVSFRSKLDPLFADIFGPTSPGELSPWLISPTSSLEDDDISAPLSLS